ncbi:MAG: cupin domain-containing protein [Candidatus Dormibacteraeota bacterium]|nr:cupin domain-containing protein [Candidatus Dormibacteraeota bacterium]
MSGDEGPRWVPSAEMPVRKPVAGWTGRFFSSPHVTFGMWDVAEGAAPVHEHAHPEEEVWIVLWGRLAVTIAGEERVVEAGDAAFVPGGVLHRVRPLGAARAIAADHPVRPNLPGSHGVP